MNDDRNELARILADLDRCLAENAPMSNSRNHGCEGLPDDKLQKLRDRFLQHGQTNPRSEIELGSTEQRAERLRLQQRDASARDGTGEQRGRGCSG